LPHGIALIEKYSHSRLAFAKSGLFHSYQIFINSSFKLLIFEAKRKDEFHAYTDSCLKLHGDLTSFGSDFQAALGIIPGVNLDIRV
jgi:hypothetical protein